MLLEMRPIFLGEEALLVSIGDEATGQPQSPESIEGDLKIRLIHVVVKISATDFFYRDGG